MNKYVLGMSLAFICFNSYANMPYNKPICQQMEIIGDGVYKM